MDECPSEARFPLAIVAVFRCAFARDFCVQRGKATPVRKERSRHRKHTGSHFVFIFGMASAGDRLPSKRIRHTVGQEDEEEQEQEEQEEAMNAPVNADPDDMVEEDVTLHPVCSPRACIPLTLFTQVQSPAHYVDFEMRFIHSFSSVIVLIFADGADGVGSAGGRASQQVATN